MRYLIIIRSLIVCHSSYINYYFVVSMVFEINWHLMRFIQTLIILCRGRVINTESLISDCIDWL